MEGKPPQIRSKKGESLPIVCEPDQFGDWGWRVDWELPTSTDFTGHQLKPLRALPNPPFRRPSGGYGLGIPSLTFKLDDFGPNGLPTSDG